MMSVFELVVTLFILVQCRSVTSNEVGICGSLDLRNDTSLQRLRGCRVIEGYLQIVLMNHQNKTVSFPELREITHFLLVYNVKGLKSLGSLFPNLAVIRGVETWVDNAEHYSLMVFGLPDLEELALVSLTNILNGSVRIEKNPNLCFMSTINWNRTISSGRILNRDNRENCDDWKVCKDSKCKDSRCWKKDRCQLDSKNLSVPGTGVPCHQECLGGCTGPGPHQCFVCRRVLESGTCQSNCSDFQFEFMGRRCLTEEQCQNQTIQKHNDVKTFTNWIPFNGSCLLQCPIDYKFAPDPNTNNIYTCVKCKDYCRKECRFEKDKHNIQTIKDMQRFRGCTQINGNLSFQLKGRNNVTNDLIDGFGLVRIIKGSLMISRSESIYSLNFMPHLHTILVAQNQTAIIINGNPNLEELWNWNQRDRKLDIQGARLQFRDNPKLCNIHIKNLIQITGTKNLANLEYVPESNGYNSVCDEIAFRANSSAVNSSTVLIEWDVIDKCHENGSDFLVYRVFYMKMSSMSEYALLQSKCGESGWQVDYVTVNITDYIIKGVKKLSHTITLLEEYQQYAYYVQVYCSDNGKRTLLSNFTTLSGTPSKPQDLHAKYNENEDMLTWKPPLYPRGDFSYYLIYNIYLKRKKIQITSCSEEIYDVDFELIKESQLQEDIPYNCNSCTAQDLQNCSSIKAPKSLITQYAHHTLDEFQSYFDDLIKYERMKLFNSTIENVIITYKNETGISQNISNGSRYFGVPQKVPANENSTVLKNLRHYSIYIFGIQACSSIGICSGTVLTSYRTQPKNISDDIDSNSVNVLVEKWGANISWESPKEPNGGILKYKLKYRRIDRQNFKPIEICFPLTGENRSRVWSNITNLMPGEYTVQVQAISFSGPGIYTSAKNFSIPHLPAVNKTTVLIIGIFAFVVTLLGLSILITRRLWKQRREVMITTVNPEYIGLVTYEPDEWEISRDKVQLIREISQGSFGMVYEGILQPCNTRCAVKTVAETASTMERVEFLNEACVMKQFSEGHHIVRLLGVVSKGQPPMVVMELMERGDLKKFLRSARDVESEEHSLLSCTNDSKNFTYIINLNKLLIMAAEIADGMAYLEACKFVHRDLAARNCMIAHDLTVKIGDFGMARDVYENDYYRKGSKGLLPVRWMAPESLADGVFTSQSDVWSFGIVLWEIATLAEQPYQGMASEQVLYFVKGGGRLPKPEFVDTIMYDLMCACWQQHPFCRPTFLQIVASLEIITEGFGNAFEEVSFYHSEMGQRERHELHPESAEDDALLSKPLSSLHRRNNLSLRKQTQQVYANINSNQTLRPLSQHKSDS